MNGLKKKTVKLPRNYEDYGLYVAARKVADLVFEYASSDPNRWLQDTREDPGGLDAAYNQTESGLFLEIYRGQISSIWTPWGDYIFCGNTSGDGTGSWRLVNTEILKRLCAARYRPKQESVGIVFAIHCVDKLQLPQPVEREPQNYLGDDITRTAWDNMTRRYKEEHMEDPIELI